MGRASLKRIQVITKGVWVCETITQVKCVLQGLLQPDLGSIAYVRIRQANAKVREEGALKKQACTCSSKYPCVGVLRFDTAAA